MRSSVSMLVALALMTACSSQPLTGTMPGTGGVTTGAGATGGYAVGETGGTGGSAAIASCLDVANRYQQALAAAQSCDVGTDGQCGRLVNDGLGVCTSCPTYVTDSTELDLLQRHWDAGNCFAVLPKIPCPSRLCAPPATAVCAATDGGTRGTCAPQATGTGTGGSGGAVDAGASASCADLVAKYAAALQAAASCALGATDQCGQSASPTLLPCRSDCVQFVNDTSTLDAIRQIWDQQGCSKTAGAACPALTCSPGGGPACVETDASGPSCGTAVLLR